jgi:hypothetical protein
LDLTPKTSSGVIAEFLPPVNNEQHIWTTPATTTIPGDSTGLYTFYWSSRYCTGADIGCDGAYGVSQGYGLARIETNSHALSGKRIDVRNGNVVTNPAQTCNPIANCLVFTAGDTANFHPTAIVDGGNGDAYVLMTDGIDTRLAKAPLPSYNSSNGGSLSTQSLINRNYYSFWKDDGSSEGVWIADLPQATKLWQQPNTPLGVPTMNDFTLFRQGPTQQWMAVYSTAFQQLVARTAPEVRGPWSAEQVLVECGNIVTSAPNFFGPLIACYAGTVHREFNRSSDTVMYLSHANRNNGYLYLQEVLLGTPVYQWEDGQGRTAYRREGQGGPSSGFASKGVAFYAYYDGPDCASSGVNVQALYGINPIYEWFRPSTGDYLYTASASTPPLQNFTLSNNSQPVFCAATSPGAQLAPIQRYQEMGTNQYVYSALPLDAELSFVNLSADFYAKITNYHVWADHVGLSFPNEPSAATEAIIGPDGSSPSCPNASCSLTRFGLSGLQPFASYTIKASDPFVGSQQFPGVAADSAGKLDISVANFMTSGVVVITVVSGPLPTGCCTLTRVHFSGLAEGLYHVELCSPNACSEDPSPITYDLSTPAAGTLAWSTDRDRDYFMDVIEERMGTFVDVACASDPNHPELPNSAYPLDLHGNTGQVRVDDILAEVNQYYSTDPRYDFHGTGKVRIGDILFVVQNYFADCSP